MIPLFRFLSRLPLSWLHALGALLGWLTWLASPTYRRHLQQNLVLALGERAAARVRAQAIAEAGKTALELPAIWLQPLEVAAAHVVQVSGWELIEAARRQGRGVLFMTPHLGCFEITAQYCSQSAPITVLYRPPKQAWLQQMILEGRQRAQLKLAAADLSGVRALIKALKRGEAVGMLPDQAPKVGEGRWLDFFGKPAYTMTLAARLSETGACILFVWAERLPGGAGYHFRIGEPAAPIEGDTVQRAQCINREIERLIRECPQQYLWGYNRYKRPAGAEAPPDGKAQDALRAAGDEGDEGSAQSAPLTAEGTT